MFVTAHSASLPLYRHTLEKDAHRKIRVCLHRGTVAKIPDDRIRRTCYRFNGLKPSNSQPIYLKTRGGNEFWSP